jgi:hypothetical protein
MMWQMYVVSVLILWIRRDMQTIENNLSSLNTHLWFSYIRALHLLSANLPQCLFARK